MDCYECNDYHDDGVCPRELAAEQIALVNELCRPIGADKRDRKGPL